VQTNSSDRHDFERKKWEDYYDSLASIDPEKPVELFGEELAERIGDLLPAGSEVLEAGCGAGWQSLSLSRIGKFRLTLSDFSESALHTAQEIFEKEQATANFVRENVFDPGKADFDLVFNVGALEHYEYGEQVRFLRGLASRSRKYVLVVVPNELCYWYWISRIHNASEGNWPFGREVPLADLSGLFEASGLHFYGQRFMARPWTEFFISNLTGIEDGLRARLRRIHGSDFIPDAQASYLVAGLGGHAPSGGEKEKQHWHLPISTGGPESAELRALAADSLSLRLSAEREIAKLQFTIADRDAVIEKLTSELSDHVSQLNQKEAEVRRVSGILAVTERQAHSLSSELQRRDELLVPIARQLRLYQANLQRELDIYRGQRAWATMLLMRKFYTLLLKHGWRGRGEFLVTLTRLMLGRPVDLSDVELQFPDLWNYVSADLLSYEALDQQADPAEPAPASIIAEAQIQPRGSAQQRYDVVILSIIDFDFRFQRPQQIAVEFARRGHRVFWISPTRFLPGSSPVPYAANLLRDYLWEVHLRGPQPDIYLGKLEAADQAIFLESLEQMFRDFAIVENCVMLQLPFWRALGLDLRDKWSSRLVYDCMDDWDTFPNLGDFNHREEEKLCLESDVLIVSAQRLYDKFERRGATPVLARNAADFEFFRSSVKPADLLKDTPRPVIGYFGAIAAWVDLHLIYEIAAARPQYSFVLIGQVFGRDVSQLESLSNVYFLGNKQYQEMPQYLREFDVCMIPFLLNEITEATDPVKLYEYFSQGKPVVATQLSELEQCRDLLYLASDAEDFAEKLDDAIRERDPRLSERRIAFAASNTWQDRVDCIDQAVRSSFPLVSILIVTHNSESFLSPCMQSIRKYTSYPNYEVIVVDNASTDQTPEILRSLAHTEERFRVVHSRENQGFAAANNIAAQLATGDYFVLLNVDTLVTSGWIGRLLRQFQRDRSIGMVCPVTNFAGNEVKINATYSNEEEMQRFSEQLAAGKKDEVREITTAPLFCALLSRAIWQEVGELDERFSVGMFEDDDYSLRLRRAGYRLLAAEECFVHHFGQGAFGKLAPGFYKQVFENNQQRFEAKWGIKWEQHKTRPGVRPAFEEKRFTPEEFLGP
jgi:GT2 family glycosyltransferase/glycosyltransferase involved in cell wall biosynthesis